MSRFAWAAAALLVAAFALRAFPLVGSPLPFNIDGFPLANAAADVLSTGAWTPDTHDSSRPGAVLLLAAASAATGIAPLALAQLLFSLLGVLAVGVTVILARRALGAGPAASLGALAALAWLGSHAYFSAATMKQATGLVLLPLALGLVFARSRRDRWLGGLVLVSLTLFHHFVAFVAIAAISLAIVAAAANLGWRRVPAHLVAWVALAFIATAAWVSAFREPIGSSWELITKDAWLFASVWTLVAFATYAVARRPRPVKASLAALGALALIGALALALNAWRPVFEGSQPSPTTLLFAAPFYGAVLLVAGWGLARLLADWREARAETRWLAIGLVGAVVATLLFATLRGLDAASFYLAQRTVDLVALALAIGYAAIFAGAMASVRWRVAAVTALLLVPIATAPIAFADATGPEFGNPVLPSEAAAASWAAAHADRIATDSRLGFVLEQAFGRDVAQTAAYDLSRGAPAPDVVLAADDWGDHGGELKPLGAFVVDLAALTARCSVVYRSDDALVAACPPAG